MSSSMSNSWLLFIQFGVLVVLVILDAVFQDDIQESGAKLDYNIQFMRNSFWDNLFIIIAQVSESLITIAFIPLYLDHSRMYGQMYTFVIISAIYMNDVLKMSYANPRPYWTDDDVDAVKCDNGFGNPSGHAMFTAPGMMFLAYIWCLNKVNPVSNMFKYSFCILIVILIGFDRLYLGVHSYGQIILGWTYGNMILTTCIFFKNKICHTLFTKGRKELNIILIHSIVILLLSIPILIYYFRDPYWPSSWSDRYFSKCDKDITSSRPMGKGLVESANLGLIIGMYLGNMLLPPEARFKSSKGKRVFYYGIMACILVGVYFLGNGYVDNVLKNLEPYIMGFFIFYIYRVILGVGFFGAFPRLLVKLKLMSLDNILYKE